MYTDVITCVYWGGWKIHSALRLDSVRFRRQSAGTCLDTEAKGSCHDVPQCTAKSTLWAILTINNNL